MAGPHRNPNAKPLPKPKTGNERRGNADAQKQARENLSKTIDKTKDLFEKVNNIGTGGGGKTSTTTSNTPIRVATTPRHKQGVMPNISTKDVGQPYSYKYNFSPEENKHRVEENYFIKKRREKYQKEHSLEGQIQTEVDKFTSTGKNTGKYKIYSTLVLNYWDKLDTVDLTPEEASALQKWYDTYVGKINKLNLETGKNESTLDFVEGAPPPPLPDSFGLDKDKFEKAWAYTQAYDKAINKWIEGTYEANKKGTATKIAGQDPNEVDSLLDVFRYAVNPNKSGSKALKNYIKGYFWNPLVNGDWGALGVNTLVNLGETLDFAGVGMRALVADQDHIWGDGKRLVEGQTEFVYSGGKANQRQLMDLGAGDLLHARHGRGSGSKGFRTKKIEQELKDAGLWEEYKKLESEWRNRDVESNALDNLRAAYTDPSKNFNANTGNLAKDIGVEMLLDPTLVLGGGAKFFSKAGAKGLTEGAIKTAMRGTVKSGISKDNQKAINNIVRQFIKTNSDNILTKGSSNITKDIQSLSDALEKNGAFEDFVGVVNKNGHWSTGREIFEKSLNKELYASIDTLNYKVVRSLHNTSELMDKFDSVMLKSVFAAPYVPGKLVSSGYHGARNEIARMLTDSFNDNIVTKILDSDLLAQSQFTKRMSYKRAMPDVITIGDMNSAYRAMENQPSAEVWEGLEKFDQSTRILKDAMNKPLSDFKDGKITASQYTQMVDDEIKRLSGGSGTRADLQKQIDDLYESAPLDTKTMVGHIYDGLKQQINRVERIEKQLHIRERDGFVKDINKVQDMDGLVELSQKYFSRDVDEFYPDDFFELFEGKQAEIAGEITPDEFQAIVRNFERRENVTIDLNPRDADVPLPDIVKDSDKKLKADIPLEVHDTLKNIQTYFTKEKHNWVGVKELRSYMFAIKNITDAPPAALHKVLYKAIGELTLRQGLGVNIDTDLLSDLIKVDSNLLEDTLNIESVVGKDSELMALHLDHLTVFDEMVNNLHFQKVLEVLQDPNSSLGNVLQKVRGMKIAPEELENNPEYVLLATLNNMLDSYSAYHTFRTAISSEVSGLTDRQVYAVLDRLFGITKNAPSDYANKAFSNVDRFIDDLQTLLVAEYGETRCSLDGARRQLVDWDSDLYKDYADEIQDPNIRARIAAIRKPGHIDPMNDVKVQMLYTILRDPTIIDDYNALSKNEREVIFSDIETDGLNKDYNGLTSIAFKRWTPIEGDITLYKILSTIEDSSTEVLYKRSLSDKELNRIDDSLLQSLYSKHPTLAGKDRETLLNDYKKFYQEEVDNTNIFASEADMMKSINQYLTDNSVIKSKRWYQRSTRIENRNVPCLVFHNTNGFDTKFIASRLRKLRVGIPKGAFQYITDLEKYSHNTLARLRQLEDDVVLTDKQADDVKEALIDFANTLRGKNSDFRIFDPRSIEIALYDLQRIIDPKNDVDDKFIQSVKDTQNIKTPINPQDVSIDKYSKNSLHAKLGLPNSDKFKESLQKLLDSSEMKKTRYDLRRACEEIGHMQGRYEKHILQNPYKSIDGFELSKTYYNLMRDAQATVPDRSWSYLSYNVEFRGSESQHYFHLDTGAKMTIDDLYNIKSFTDWINNKKQYSLLAGADEIIEPYESFFRSVIDTAIDFAKDVDEYNPFAYFKLLKQPSTPIEAFLMAKKLYDDVLVYADLEHFAEDSDAIMAAWIRGDKVDDKFTTFLQVKNMLSKPDQANLVTFFNTDAMEILSGKRYRAYIFKDEIGDVPHYIDSFRTPGQRAVSEIKEAQYKVKLRQDTLMKQNGRLLSSEFTDENVIKVQNCYDHINSIIDIFNEVGDENEDFWKAYVYFKNQINVKRRELFDYYRMSRLLESEEDLLSELMFTNGMRKVIPRFGNDLHTSQVKQLLTKIKELDSHYINVNDEGDHIVLTINPDYKPVFSKQDGIEIGRFPDSSKEYTLKEEKAIGWADFNDLLKDYDGIITNDTKYYLSLVYDLLKKTYDEIDFMTNGASRGTLGILANHSSEVKLASSFSKNTIKNSVGLDFTGDIRQWRGTNFDKSILGDDEFSWKLGSNSDDFDIFLNAVNILDEASGRTIAENQFLDTFFGDNAPSRLSDLGDIHTTDELFNMFNDSDEFVIVSLVPSNATDSGYEVKQVKIKDKLDIEKAKRNGSIYVPYDLYLRMNDTINNVELSNPVLKAWTKLCVTLKVTQLIHPGTWIRNWIDATTKTSSDSGSLATTLGYEFIAAKRLWQYQKIVRELGDDVSEITYQISGYEKYMSYDDFKDLKGFLANDAVSGGEAKRTQQIVDKFFKESQKRKVLSVNGYQSLGSDIQQFEQAFDEDKLHRLLEKAYINNPKLFNNMSMENFETLFKLRKNDNLYEFTDKGVEWVYNEIATQLIKDASKDIGYSSDFLSRSFEKFSGKVLSPMSQTEQLVRYAQLLLLRDTGHTEASAHKHIIDTHYNYNAKSLNMKRLEAIVPFATFQYNNLLYWIKRIDEDPRMIRYLERIYGQLSFQDIDQLEDENGNIDNWAVSQIMSGNVKIGSDGLYLKLNPSYLDALNWFYGGPNSGLSKIVAPLQLGIKADIELLGFDSWNIFKNTEFSYTSDAWIEDVFESTPGMNVVYKFLKYHVDDDIKPWDNTDIPFHKALLYTLPSLFGINYDKTKYNSQSYKDWLESLEDDWKWYDANLGRVVPIWDKNTDGLNNPDLNFDERRQLEFLLHGRLFDANQGKFVTRDHYISGGLNRDWDFSDKDQWKEYCELKEKYFGLVYDLNQHKFVKPEDMTEGGLNAENLEWDDVCELNERLGLYWDANQNRFLKKKDIVIGGLNKDNLTFPELCAYMYAIKGKVWSRSAHKFVKVVDPIVSFKTDVDQQSWDVFNNWGFNPSAITKDNFTYRQNGMLRSINGKYVLSEDLGSNERIFKELIEKYSYGFYSRRFGYYSGFGRGFNYNAVPLVPRKPYQNVMSIKGKPFNRAYSSTGNYAALRMAASGYKAYDDYYKFEYKYNYSYHNPTGMMNNVKRYDYYRGDHQTFTNRLT